MQLSVNGKQLDIGDSLKEHIGREVPAIVEKYFANPTDADVTVSREGALFRTDISVHVGKGIIVQGHARAVDAYAAFDEAAEHMAKRLRRYKRRLRDHHRNRSPKDGHLDAAQYVIAAETDGDPTGDDRAEPSQPVVVAEMQTRIETLSVGEAVMRMDLANIPALMFRNSAHGGLNMIYLRNDGNIGWVDPRDEGS
ncbi:MAG: ribosome hibernation-promoting factor, HPF/YfiA family [Geminicoccales bacterium]